MIRILVLFTCYNRKEKTEQCIKTLTKNQNCKMSYIVLDDNSNDGTSEMLKAYSNTVVLHGDGNSFYSGGIRQVIAKAKSSDLNQYDYVMFINDDVLFFEGAIDKLVKYENNDGKIIVGAVCDCNGVFSYGGEKMLSKHKPKFANVKINDYDLHCDTACANCVLIPRRFFVNLPNIDKVYSHAMGDFDYFFEAIRKGYEIISSDFYVGQCNDNDIKNGWRDTSLSIKERIRKKESVKGLPFKEWFHYLKKNHGLLSAIFYSITPYVKILLKR